MRRSPEISAGLLAFRRDSVLEVLLAHPGGPFWAKKDDGAWTIPKGLAEPGADLLATAQREFAEETSLAASGPFLALDGGPAKEREAGARVGIRSESRSRLVCQQHVRDRVAAQIGTQPTLSRKSIASPTSRCRPP